ncbi:MAG: hypothetical protein ACLQDY_13930 [Streptosporangiaceae bacterium]
MYQAYPGGAQMPEPQPAVAPKSLQTAVKLMYAGAALSVIELVLSLFTISAVRTAIKTAKTAKPLTHTQINDLVAFTVGFDVLISLVGIGLWLWMAWACGHGRGWGRVVSSVLFGLNTLFILLAVARPHASLGLVLSLLVWLAGLGAIVLLWQRDSSRYFAARRA